MFVQSNRNADDHIERCHVEAMCCTDKGRWGDLSLDGDIVLRVLLQDFRQEYDMTAYALSIWPFILLQDILRMHSPTMRITRIKMSPLAKDNDVELSELK